MNKITSFWKSGIIGKIVIILTAIFACCLCLVLVALIVPTPKDTAQPNQEQTSIPAPANTEKPAATAAPTATKAPTETPVYGNGRCVPASQPQIEAIRLGVKGTDTNNDIRTAWAVKSDDFENVWFVAAKIYGPSMETGTGPGVWAIGGDPQNISTGAFSVDAFAKNFSDRGTGKTLGIELSTYDDGVADAKDCAENLP